MFSKVYSTTIMGVDTIPVQVEADVCNGLPGFVMIGFLAAQVREAQDRVRASIRNAGIVLPPKKVTINISPADVRKQGSRFDLPIAAAVLSATEMVPRQSVEGAMIVGELSLDGKINPVNGILATVLKAKETGIKKCIVPYENAAEAMLVPDIEIIGMGEMVELVDYLRFGIKPEYDEDEKIFEQKIVSGIDFADIKGQESAKRAAVIAAAGFHNLLMTGPPGTGKSLIASRIPTIMPELSWEESIEITRIYSIAGRLNKNSGIMAERPFRAPHHTATDKALVGGGLYPVPGEITLAHKGVLFLDEMPEFSRSVLEVLRVPLEERKIIISRAGCSYEFPADFLMVAAMNPCPCGYFPDLEKCKCSSGDIARYKNKISHPLLDRIDLSVHVGQISYEEMTNGESAENSDKMREIVEKVCEIQKKRFDGVLRFNSRIDSSEIKKYCILSGDAEEILKNAYKKMGMSARSFHRVLKVSRTIADIDGSKKIEKKHVSEAICLRNAEEQ